MPGNVNDFEFFMKNIRLVLLFGLILQSVSHAQAQPAAPGTSTVPSRQPRPAQTAPAAPSLPSAPPQPTVQPPGMTTQTKPQEAKNPMEEMAPLNLENMPLVQALDIYADLVDRTILRSSQLPVTQSISLKTRGELTRAESITALETVLAMNGITIIPVGEKFIKVVPSAEAPTQGADFVSRDADELPVAGRYVTQIVSLKNVAPQDVANALAPFVSMKTGTSIVPVPNSSTLILRDYSENVKRMLEVIERVDQVNELELKPELIPIKYALASDIAQVIGSLTASGPGLSVGSSSRTGLGTTASRSTTGLGQTGTSQTGFQNQANLGSSGIGSQATSNRSNFQNRLQSIVNRASGSGDFQILSEAKIIADERTNSLLIFANKQDMAMIKHIISQLDVVLAQVLIEAIIMEVSLDDSMNVGLSYQQQPKKLGGDVRTVGGVINNNNFLNPTIGNLFAGATNATGPIISSGLPGGFSYFGTIGNSFDVALTAAARDSRVNVLSRPKIQTSHAVPASLFIGQTVPYVTGTYFGGINSGSSSQYQQKEVGITLDVLPLINPDGLVVMDIQQNIEQLGTPINIDGNDVPTTTKRMAAAKVAVRDRETIVLGGFISTSKTKSKSGVPYLKDIPLLGALFRNRSDTGQRVELMVFLRPTVLPTPEAAAITANIERESLPGVRQTEFEIREEERKRNDQIEADMRKKLGLKEGTK